MMTPDLPRRDILATSLAGGVAATVGAEADISEACGVTPARTLDVRLTINGDRHRLDRLDAHTTLLHCRVTTSISPEARRAAGLANAASER